MEFLRNAFLIIHIGSGTLALLMGLGAMLSKKGGSLHKKSGLIFFYAMLGVSFSAFYLSIVGGSLFLFHIGIFSLYMNYAGFRAIKNKSLKPSIPDWIALIIATVNALFMVLSFQIVVTSLGAINLFLVVGDIVVFSKVLRGVKLPKLQWLARHIAMMIGAYIATLTAFIVVNVDDFHPAWLPWLLPSIVGSPLIAFWIRKHTKPKKVTP